MNPPVIIVSGLPPSGTSVMMQMLDAGGIEAVTDNIRTADTDNPRGYYEFEKVKKTKADPSWVPTARGKVVKMVSQLLYDLPAAEQYRIVFMERDLDEMLQSQEKMLERLKKPAAPRDQIKKAYLAHLDKLNNWLKLQKNMEVLRVSYNDLMSNPEAQAQRVSQFLDSKANPTKMLGAIDSSLYRNRKSEKPVAAAPG